MDLGYKIIKLRELENLTTEELSEKLKVSKKELISWEDNKSKPDIIQVKKISEIFKIRIDELLANNNICILDKKIDKIKDQIIELQKKYNSIHTIIYIISILLIIPYIYVIVASVVNYLLF